MSTPTNIEFQNDDTGDAVVFISGGNLTSSGEIRISNDNVEQAFIDFVTGQGGTVKASGAGAFVFSQSKPYINFQTGSTGILEVPAYEGTTDFEDLWDSGNIRVDDANSGTFAALFTELPGGKLVLTASLGVPEMVVGTTSFTGDGTAEPFALTLTNTGGSDLVITDVGVSGTNSTTVSGLTYDTPIAGGSSTGDIDFTFTPDSGAGTYNFDFTITSNDSLNASPQVVPVTVTVEDPALNIASSLNYDPTSAVMTPVVPFTNDGGTLSLNISGVTATGTDSDKVTAITFDAITAPGASGNVGFTFTAPTAGMFNFNLSVASDDTSEASPRVIPVTVEVSAPIIAASTSAIRWVPILTNAAPEAKTVTITNNSDAGLDLNVTGTNITGTDAGQFAVTSTPGPIAPGASADLEVTYTPTGTPGEYNATLEISSDDYDGTVPSITLNVIEDPVDPALRFDFGASGSNVATGYTLFESFSGSNVTVGDVSTTMTAPNLLVGKDDGGPDDLRRDTAQTNSGNTGTNGDYISFVFTGLNTGDLKLITTHNRTGSFNPDLKLQFGEVGSLVDYATGVEAVNRVEFDTTVDIGKTYELRVAETSTNNSAYIASLVLSGTALTPLPPSAFGTWVQTFGLDPDWEEGDDPALDGRPEGDPDGDGVTNLEEFGLDDDPTSGAASGKVVGKIADVGGTNYLTLTFPVRGTPFFAYSEPNFAGMESDPVDGIVYRVQGASDLIFEGVNETNVDEVDPAIVAGLPPLNVGWTYRTFRTASEVGTDPKDFMRILVEEAP